MSFFQEFMEALEQVEKSTEYHDIIFAGDFNTSFTTKDKVGDKGSLPGHPKVVLYLQEVFEQKNIVDIWRLRHPIEKRFTYFCTKPCRLMERLDYIFISASLSSKIVLTDIEPAFLSDHSIPITVLTDSQVLKRDPGYWKLNVKMLDLKDYCDMVHKQIVECTERYHDSMLRLEMIKLLVRGESIKFGARKKKARNNLLEALENKLYRLVK